ncbi:hypothetical protein HYW59_01390 [Candidatus Kaiserbacteria bacterium]|nr:hypothetical protein [Candidatus Kaiserbacteria bacterium]
MRHAARFARAEGEVRAEDFLEGGFFGEEVLGFCCFFKHLSLLYPLLHGFEPMFGVPLQAQDIFLQRPLFGHERTLPLKIVGALNILLHKEVGEAGNFAVQVGNLCPHRLNGRRRRVSSFLLIALCHFVKFVCPFLRHDELCQQT